MIFIANIFLLAALGAVVSPALTNDSTSRLIPVADKPKLSEQQTLEELQSDERSSPERVASLIDFARSQKYDLSLRAADKVVVLDELNAFNEMNIDKCRNWRLWAGKCGKLRELEGIFQYCRSAMEEAAERCADLYAKLHFRSIAERLFMWTIWQAVQEKRRTGLFVVDSPLGKEAGL